MKGKIIAVLLVLTLLAGCTARQENSTQQPQSGKYAGKATAGVWLSYSEINGMLASQKGFENKLYEVIENCKELKIGNAYIHVRSFCDSLYPSEYFPLIEGAESYSYDILEFIIGEFHKEGIKVHAWINPYRVYTASSDIEALRNDSPAYKWLTDDNSENDRNVCFANGIYLNPAEQEAQQLVLDGIREIITNYAVDGIHFDDYFYPTVETDFDSVSYEAYKASAQKPLSLEAWRRANVNALISGCYTAIKAYDKDIVFSISPAASIENNYSSLFADVEYWVENGYVDCIIPQLYFGFEYPTEEFAFEKLIDDWKRLVAANEAVELIIGLATYKIGTETEPDRAEWQNNDDIIAQQVRLCTEDDKISGYVYFSYSSLVSDEDLNTRQRTKLLEYIN